jgi:hypothetical protein
MSKYTETARRLLQQPNRVVAIATTSSVAQANNNAEQIVQAAITTRLVETVVPALMFPSSPGTTTNLLRADRVVAPVIRNTVPSSAVVVIADGHSFTVAGSFTVEGTLTLLDGATAAFF